MLGTGTGRLSIEEVYKLFEDLLPDSFVEFLLYTSLKDEFYIDNYIENTVYDFVAFYLAKGYELSALWESSLKSHVHSAINTLEGIKFIKDYDYEKLKLIILQKYSLLITDDETTNMQKITRD